MRALSRSSSTVRATCGARTDECWPLSRRNRGGGPGDDARPAQWSTVPASTSHRPHPRARRLATALVAAVALLATSCGGDDDSSDDVQAPTSTAPSVPEGITPPGETFNLGDTATVVYPNAKRASRIELSVTKVRRGKLKDLSQFDLDRDTRKSTVYYVDAKVRNVGRGDLSGQPLTLFGKVSDQLVVQPAVFGSPYPPCNYHDFPKKFTAKRTTNVCMVMFAPQHGKISEIQWRGADSEPIAWTPR